MTDHLDLHNGSLFVGQTLTSPGNKAYLTLQSDGNLVLYQSGTNMPLWASNTAGKPAYRASIQGDSNFVIYDKNSHPLWATNTGNLGAHNSGIFVQDDGNLVIYKDNRSPTSDPSDRNKHAIWDSGTYMFAVNHNAQGNVHQPGFDLGVWMTKVAQSAGTSVEKAALGAVKKNLPPAAVQGFDVATKILANPATASLAAVSAARGALDGIAKQGFDLAGSIHVGAATVQVPPGLTPDAQAAYLATHGMQTQSASNKAALTVGLNPVGVSLAQQHLSWWGRLKAWWHRVL